MHKLFLAMHPLMKQQHITFLPAQFQVLADRFLDDIDEHSGTSTHQVAVTGRTAHSTIC
jgi:hypothetical protein